jgi:hypothetical protein
LTDIWNHEFLSRDGLFAEVTSVIGVPFLHGGKCRERLRCGLVRLIRHCVADSDDSISSHFLGEIVNKMNLVFER